MAAREILTNTTWVGYVAGAGVNSTPGNTWAVIPIDAGQDLGPLVVDIPSAGKSSAKMWSDTSTPGRTGDGFISPVDDATSPRLGTYFPYPNAVLRASGRMSSYAKAGKLRIQLGTALIGFDQTPGSDTRILAEASVPIANQTAPNVITVDATVPATYDRLSPVVVCYMPCYYNSGSTSKSITVCEPSLLELDPGDVPSGQPPTAPTNLVEDTAHTTSTAIGLAWDAGTDDISVIGYNVYRNGARVNFPDYVPTTSYVDTGLIIHQSCIYTVRTVDSSLLESVDSAPLSARALPDQPPTDPTNLVLQVYPDGDGQDSHSITCNWTASTDDASVWGYQVWANGVGQYEPTRYHDEGFGNMWGGTEPANRARLYLYGQFDVGDLVAVEVRAAAANGQMSVGSAKASCILGVSVTGTPPPDDPPKAPSQLTATNVPTGIKLSWKAATDDHGVAGYRVYRNTLLVNTTSLFTGTTVTLGGHTPGTVYAFTVRAVDTVGQESPDSNGIAIQAPSVDAPPTAPTGLTATTVDDSITLSWLAGTDDVGVAGYHVYRNGVLTNPDTLISGLTTTMTGHTPGTVYTFTVRAVDTTGQDSPNSNALAVTAGGAVTHDDPPTIPTGLAVNTVTSTAVTLQWLASTDDVGITGYRVYRNGLQTGISTGLGYSDSGLSPNTGYTYAVRAVDTAGQLSALSASVSVVTLTATGGVGDGGGGGGGDGGGGGGIVVDSQLGQRVADFLGASGDLYLVEMAGQSGAVVTAMVNGYTRGKGFTPYPDERLTAVIVSATARLVSNPEQELNAVGSVQVRSSFQGFTLAERAILNNYRTVWA